MIKDSALKLGSIIIEQGYMPDSLTRVGIRSLLKSRLAQMKNYHLQYHGAYQAYYVKQLKSSSLAIMTSEANQQHYEVPTAFYDLCLGAHKKYSSCYWNENTTTLEEAEVNALNISIERAEIKDGMNILELGCGWGSLSLELAKRFPHSHITSVSNSKTQKAYIDQRAKERGLNNLTVLTRNLALAGSYDFGDQRFDRVMTIEMMEHLRNYELFFKFLSPSVKDDGKMFIHIFTHKETPYFFETEGEDNWMGRYFFSGGQMPSRNLFDSFNEHFSITQKWDWSGIHYSKTLEAWLARMDDNKKTIMQMFQKIYGTNRAHVWFNRWRVFFMASSELFAYNQGNEWTVTHYLLEKNKAGL